MGESRDERNARKREEYQKLKEQGICVRCKKKPSAPNRTACMECLRKMSKYSSQMFQNRTPEQQAKIREYKKRYNREHRDEMRQDKKERREYYSAKGICIYCGANNAVKGKRGCYECLERKARQKREYLDSISEEEREKLREMTRKRFKNRYVKRKAEHRCVACGKILSSDNKRVYCTECRLKHLREAKERYDKFQRRTDNIGIPRSEWIQYGICYICGNQIDVEGERVCSKCKPKLMINVGKAQKAAYEMWHKNGVNTHPWYRDNKVAFQKIRPI